MQKTRLSDRVQAQLRCPACTAPLDVTAVLALCTNATCGARYPILEGVPVLINEKNSVFSLDDFAQRRDTTFILKRGRLETLVHAVADLLPEISAAVGTKENYSNLRDRLLALSPAPKVLVLGGSIEGVGMDALTGAKTIELVASDVSFGPLTDLICDGHDIPFEDGTFDGVIAQAVLEHVVDPYRCVEEIHRVLKDGGLVYAETPFMQQVHMGRYDFTRFTHSGHRRLFRQFDEIASGPTCGPGMALAWSYQYFLLSFASSKPLRGLMRIVGRLTAFPLKYFDYYLVKNSAACDAASGFHFIGRKAGRTLSDRDLIKYYRGALSN